MERLILIIFLMRHAVGSIFNLNNEKPCITRFFFFVVCYNQHNTNLRKRDEHEISSTSDTNATHHSFFNYLSHYHFLFFSTDRKVGKKGEESVN